MEKKTKSFSYKKRSLKNWYIFSVGLVLCRNIQKNGIIIDENTFKKECSEIE